MRDAYSDVTIRVKSEIPDEMLCISIYKYVFGCWAYNSACVLKEHF